MGNGVQGSHSVLERSQACGHAARVRGALERGETSRQAWPSGDSMKVLVSMLSTQPVLSSGPEVCHSPVTG